MHDVSVLSQTLQQVMNPIDVIRELCRISKSAIVVTFPNFWVLANSLAIIDIKLKLSKPSNYRMTNNTPNIRVITVNAFHSYAAKMSLVLQKEIPLLKFKLQRLLFPLGLTNLFTQKRDIYYF